jgi:vanillate O-demethylase ferredoxin subunit
MMFNLREVIVPVHRWAGLIVGSVILMLALTGISNLFRQELEPIVNESLITSEVCQDRASLDLIVEKARQFHPGGELDYVNVETQQLPTGRIPAIRIRFSDPQEDVFVNPCSAEVQGERPRYGGILGRIEQLHIFRVSEEEWVRSLTGVFALAFAITVLGGGIFLWWPKNMDFKRVLTFKTPLKNKAKTLHEHKVIGVYASLILLAMAMTGLPLSFGWYKEGIYAVTGSLPMPKAPKSVVSTDGQKIGIEAFWQQAQMVSNEVPVRALLKFHNKKADAPMEGFLINQNAPHVHARSMIYVDAYSGKVLKYLPYSENSLGHKIYFWMLSFHTGQVGGVLGKIVLLFGAGSVPFMAFTGWKMYLSRRKLSQGKQLSKA